MVDAAPLASGNLIVTSDLTAPYWTLQGYSVTAPPGTIREIGGAAAAHSYGMTSPIARAAGVNVYTRTVDLVPAGSDVRWMAVGGFAAGLGAGAFQYFDVINGVMTGASGYGGFTFVDSSMVALPGGGFHCQMTFQTGGALAGLVALDQAASSPGNFSFVGNPLDGFTVSNIGLFDVSPIAGFAATPVVIGAMNEATTLKGPTTPYVMVTGPVLPGPATRIAQVSPGRPMLPGRATPMQVVTGRPVLPGKATPIA